MRRRAAAKARDGRILQAVSTPRPTASEPPTVPASDGWSLEEGSRQHAFRREGSGQRLTRSRRDRVLIGLCGGIAEFTGSRPGVVRLLFVLSTLVSLGVVAFGYLLLSLMIPAEPRNEP